MNDWERILFWTISIFSSHPQMFNINLGQALLNSISLLETFLFLGIEVFYEDGKWASSYKF